MPPLLLAESALDARFLAATAAAAAAARRWVGSGDGMAVDAAAVAAMRAALSGVDVDGRVVVGEGEKDAAPMLHLGERFGTGAGPSVDIAVDPVDGTRLAAAGLAGAMAVMAVAPRGALLDIGPAHYMEKLVSRVPGLRIDAPLADAVARIAEARGIDAAAVRVAVQERPRNDGYVRAARAAGASVELFEHGDVERCLRAAQAGADVDLVVGIGGAPEGVLTAAGVRALGGWMQARLAPQGADEAGRLAASGRSADRVHGLDELCGDDAWLFLTAVTACTVAPGRTLQPGESWSVAPARRR